MPIREEWLTGIAFVFGLWVLAAPFVLGASGAPLWNGVVVGGLVAALTAYEYTRKTTEDRTWSAWTATVLGLWTVISPFVLGMGATMQWSNVIAGLVIALASGYTGYAASERFRRGTPQA